MADAGGVEGRAWVSIVADAKTMLASIATLQTLQEAQLERRLLGRSVPSLDVGARLNAVWTAKSTWLRLRVTATTQRQSLTPAHEDWPRTRSSSSSSAFWWRFGRKTARRRHPAGLQEALLVSSRAEPRHSAPVGLPLPAERGQKAREGRGS